MKVSVLLKNSYTELSNCKTKIQQQLAYLEGVYYKIEGFENQYTVYRSEDFQFSSLNATDTQMHISLKNIRYPIDWSKIGISMISIPVGLRFDDYSELKPIFNRESIQYNSQTIKAIQDKIAKVCQWFVEKWNAKATTFTDFPSAIYTLSKNQRQLDLFGKTFHIEVCEKHGGVIFAPAIIPNITLRDPSFYLSILDYMHNRWGVDAIEDRGVWRKKHLNYDWSNYFSSKKYNATTGTKVVLVNYAVVGNIKEYLRGKYRDKVIYVNRLENKKLKPPAKSWGGGDTYYEMLQLRGIPKSKWRDYIKEYYIIEDQFHSTFIDERNIESNPLYIQWLQAKRDLAKANRVIKPAKSKALAKGEGDITVYVARLPLRSADIEVAYDKVKKGISSLPTTGKLVVYGDIKENFPKWLVVTGLSGRFNVWAFNPTEIKYVKDFTNFVTLEEFMETKPFARMATAFLIEQLLKQEPSQMEIVRSTFPKIDEQKKKLKKYLDDNLCYGGEEVKSAVLEMAAESNTWDMTIHSELIDYGKKVRSFGFLNALKDGNDWRTNQITKKIIQNMMYIMLKHQKLNNTLVEEYDLVPKPVAALLPDEDAAVIIEEVTEELPF